ncbi:MAG: hypothetical protein EPN76_11680 [Burkholderiaceae bacterium]|nr:MAG: hypothetical protein EPN76_11680 [Burkholderiaceae bacterium]TAM08159.1 MAG: hypothetical protein EPN67_02890 [Pusillimonas sp.]
MHEDLGLLTLRHCHRTAKDDILNQVRTIFLGKIHCGQKLQRLCRQVQQAAQDARQVLIELPPHFSTGEPSLDHGTVNADAAKCRRIGRFAQCVGLFKQSSDFRAVLREVLETSKDVVGTQGVYNMTKADHSGLDNRSSVFVQIENGRWMQVQ